MLAEDEAAGVGHEAGKKLIFPRYSLPPPPLQRITEFLFFGTISRREGGRRREALVLEGTTKS